MTVIITGLLVIAGALAAAASGVQDRGPASKPVPVLAELFTSEGCSSCPPADDLLRRLIDQQPVEGVQVIALAEHVDYWDHLGWKDPFSSRDFTQRQNDYAKAFRSSRIYTPQLVVDGRLEAVGSDVAAVRRALAEAAGSPHATLAVSAAAQADGRLLVRVSVRDVPGPASAARLRVIAAIVEDELTTSVRHGENARRILRHSGVARSLTAMGLISDGAAAGEFSQTLDVGKSWRVERLRVVVFLQDERTRQIFGAASAAIG